MHTLRLLVFKCVIDYTWYIPVLELYRQLLYYQSLLIITPSKIKYDCRDYNNYNYSKHNIVLVEQLSYLSN